METKRAFIQLTNDLQTNTLALALCIMQIDAHNCYLKISGHRVLISLRAGLLGTRSTAM